MPSNVSVFLTEGFSPEFYYHLGRFSRKLYRKYEVTGTWDEFYENVRAKVEDVLSKGVYDPSKGNFVSFIHGMVRNEGTKISLKTKRVVHFDAPENSVISLNLTSSGLVDPTMARFREDFAAKADELGIPLDLDEFESDLILNRLTPMVFAYLWLVHTRGRRGISF